MSNSRMKERIFPFLSWFKDVNGGTMRADLGAGLTGAIMVLPQGVAFAMIAGMPPIYGLYSAMNVKGLMKGLGPVELKISDLKSELHVHREDREETLATFCATALYEIQ